MRIMFTAFKPFGGASWNASEEIINALPETHVRCKLIKVVLPVRYKDAFTTLKRHMDEQRPDAILMMGEARGRKRLSIEQIAVNLNDARRPDEAGVIKSGETIDPDGPDGIFTTLPVDAILEALASSGIPYERSLSAGGYVCNDLFYRALRHADVPAGFIHIPVAHECDAPPRDFNDFAEALKSIVTALVERKDAT